MQGLIRRVACQNLSGTFQICSGAYCCRTQNLHTSVCAVARVRDFRGVNPNAFDGRGNYALGIKEQLIFPEIEYDKVDKVRGMDIIFVTTAKTDEEARELLTQFNMPFTK